VAKHKVIRQGYLIGGRVLRPAEAAQETLLDHNYDRDES